MNNIKRIFHTEDGIRISSSFGSRTSPITGNKEFHRGVDYATKGRKLPQYAIDDGYVAKCGIDNTGAIFAEVAFINLGYVGQYYHLDRLSVKQGQKVDKNTIIGYTGSTGMATGIHLHFGWFPIKDLNTDYYKRRWENFESFKFKEEVINMERGYIVEKLLEKEVHIYIQENNDLKLGLISAGDKDNSLNKINLIDDDRIHFAKMNAGYFEMADKSIYGLHYGVEISPQIELAPKKDNLLVVYVMKDENQIKVAKSSEFWYGGKDVEFAITPYSIPFHNDVDQLLISTALGNKENLANTQSMLVQLKDNTIAFLVFTGKVFPNSAVKFAKEYFRDKLSHVSLYDSGGSSQLIVKGEKKVYTGRELPNVLTLFQKGKPAKPADETPGETAAVDPEEVVIVEDKPIHIKPQINFGVRWKNPVFILQIILSVLIPVLAYLGLELKDIDSWNKLQDIFIKIISNPYVLGMMIVGVWNAVNDPTVSGVSDSKRALTYKEPKPNANEEDEG